MSPQMTMSRRIDVISLVNERALSSRPITVEGPDWTDTVRNIAGTRLEHPVVHTRDGRRFEISWHLAARLASGDSDRILF